MQLNLFRRTFTDKSTIGDLYVGEKWQCFTLEDVVRDGPKVPGKTAIPTGLYQVVVTFSNRFQKPLPLLIGVPGFEGVRIHPGNTEHDTEGCVLVGLKEDKDFVGDSRRAFTLLFDQIKAAAKQEKIWIQVANN